MAQLAVLALVITAATFGLFQFSTTVRAIVLLRRLVDRVDVAYPQLQAMATLVLSIEDLSAAYSAVEATQAHPDARTSILGNVMGAQLAENGGDVEGARVFALRARELAEQVGDEWGATMSRPDARALQQRDPATGRAFSTGRRSRARACATWAPSAICTS